MEDYDATLSSSSETKQDSREVTTKTREENCDSFGDLTPEAVTGSPEILPSGSNQSHLCSKRQKIEFE